MKVCLLYEDRERSNEETYYDTASIIQDLGLKALFLAASRKLIMENGEVKKVEQEDTYLMDTLRTVMMVPLHTEKEIEFRQQIIKDAFKHEDLIRSFYEISRDTLAAWNELGRGPREKMQQTNPVVKLTTDIRVLQLLTKAIGEIKILLTEAGELSSAGLKKFKEDLFASFSDEREEYVKKILGDISFYTDRIEQSDDGKSKVIRPRIIMESGLEDGFKFSSLKLEEVSSQSTKFYKPGSTMYKLREFMDGRVPDTFSVTKDVRINDQAQQLEYMVVSYLTEELKGVMEEFRTFFDRLKFQAGFYYSAILLREQMKRFKMGWCFPKVCDRRDLEFCELKEFVMALEQRVNVVGNTCSLSNKDLLIVTGANQGGKSTFLRSIGIAQVMMQCGLMVTAESFSSGIFPKIFVHFTRREDSEMNSGRLDEELGRMSRIIEQIGDGSLILLNESFATTTEKEGSVIAYDIITALREAGVKILTVTHLLSFARRVHEQMQGNPESGVEFFSAERKEGGGRTFKMIRHEPELTSFGLDLYKEIVEKG